MVLLVINNDIHTINGKISFLILGGCKFIILHMLLNTKYIIHNKLLKIKCGLFNYKPIDIMKIKSVKKSDSYMSSPASSFDRIEIRYGKFDDIIISPDEQHLFIKELKVINPTIENRVNK